MVVHLACLVGGDIRAMEMATMTTTGDHQTSTHASELDLVKTSRLTTARKPQMRVVFHGLGGSIVLQDMVAAVLVMTFYSGNIYWDDENRNNDNDIHKWVTVCTCRCFWWVFFVTAVET